MADQNNHSHCKECGAAVKFIRTPNGGKMPVNVPGTVVEIPEYRHEKSKRFYDGYGKPFDGIPEHEWLILQARKESPKIISSRFGYTAHFATCSKRKDRQARNEKALAAGEQMSMHHDYQITLREPEPPKPAA